MIEVVQLVGCWGSFSTSIEVAQAFLVDLKSLEGDNNSARSVRDTLKFQSDLEPRMSVLLKTKYAIHWFECLMWVHK